MVHPTQGLLAGASILEGWGSRTPDFGQGVVKYYYILSYTGSMFGRGDFWQRNRIICPEVAVNDKFLPGKSIFFCEICLEKIKISRKFAWKNQIFLPGSTTQISNQIDAATYWRHFISVWVQNNSIGTITINAEACLCTEKGHLLFSRPTSQTQKSNNTNWSL